MDDNNFAAPNFLADKMLGKLAKYLRFIGLDTLYADPDMDDPIKRAVDESRILLTKHLKLIRLCETSKEPVCFYPDDNNTDIQFILVYRQFNLEKWKHLPGRCLVCNYPLKQISGKETEGLIPGYIQQKHDTFSFCRNCNKILWQGSHMMLLKEKIKILKSLAVNDIR